MSNQILISSGAKLRDLDDVIIGTDGVLTSLGFNVANGVPKLDENGKILVSQLPNSVMEFKGVWNAATNTPTLADGTGNAGDVYLCNVAGTVNFGSGPIAFAVGDYAVYTGTVWARSSGATGTVTSVGLSRSGDALTVTGSPITTSGTINIGFAGTNLQYINGAGNLVTFPTIATEAQRLITEVYNETGATLAKGSIVYINGGHGNLPTVTKAIATGDPTSAQTYGIVQNDIGNMNNGFVVVSGSLIDLDTQTYPEGTQLYLSGTTAGAWTSTKPYAPIHLVYVAIVTRSHPTQGVVEVSIQNGYEMDELHNVAAQNPDNNDILQYKTSTSLWTKVAGTTSNIAEGSNQYFTNARARAAISLTTTGSTGAATYDNSTGVLNIPQYTDQYVGTVTSVGLSAPTGFSVTGSPVTSSGTLALSFASGYSLPTNVKQSNWDDAYTWVAAFPTQTGNAGKFLTTDGSTLSWATVIAGVQSVTASSPLFSSGGANPNITIQVATTSQNGYLSSTDWNTFNSKQNALTNPVTGTGTTNNLPKFTGTSTIGDSLFTDNGTNGAFGGANYSFGTGVRTFNITAPQFAGVAFWTSSGYSGDIFSYESTGNLIINADPNNTISSSNLFLAVDGTTIATLNTTNTTFSRPLIVNGSSVTDVLKITSTGANVDIWLTDSGTTAGNNRIRSQNNEITLISAGYNSLFLSNTGKVGMGTTAPQSQAQVYKSADLSNTGDEYQYAFWVSQTSINRGILLGYSNTYNAGIIQSSDVGTAWKHLILNPIAGTNVMIGTTTNAGYKLDVNGTGRFSGNLIVQNGYIQVNGASNGYLNLNATSTGGNESGIFFQVGGANKWENYTANNDTALNWYSYANSTIVLKLASNGAATFSSSVTAKGSGNYNGFIADNGNAATVGGGYFSAFSFGSQRGIFGIAGAISGSVDNNIAIFAEGGAGQGAIKYMVNGSGTASHIMTSDGNVMFGTTSGVSGGGKLQVNGNVNINGVFQINGVTIGGGGGSGVTGSGTTNYVTKWTGSTTLGNGVMYDNGTNIGVGTTSPASKFEVAKVGGSYPTYTRINLDVTTDLFPKVYMGQGISGGYIGYDEAGSERLVLNASDAGSKIEFLIGGANKMSLLSSGRLLINTTTDNGYALQINGSASFAYGYLSIFRGSSSPNDILVGNDGSRFYIGGNTYVAGSITATGGFFDTSDARLKTLVEDNYLLSSIANVKAKLYTKGGRKELGYYAQDLLEILPSAVSEGSDGFLSLSYAQVHTAKIAVIEDEVTTLKNRVSELEKQLNLN